MGRWLITDKKENDKKKFENRARSAGNDADDGINNEWSNRRINSK